MYGMTPMGVFFTAIFPLEINEQALCQQPQYGTMVSEITGQSVVDPNAFTYVDNENPVGFMDFFSSIHDGLVNAAGTYASLLLIAGTLGIL